MELGMIGLGRMGGNMVRRLIRAGHRCVVFDVSAEAVQGLAREGGVGATRVDDRFPPGESMPTRVESDRDVVTESWRCDRPRVSGGAKEQK